MEIQLSATDILRDQNAALLEISRDETKCSRFFPGRRVDMPLCPLERTSKIIYSPQPGQKLPNPWILLKRKRQRMLFRFNLGPAQRDTQESGREQEMSEQSFPALLIPLHFFG